MLALAAAPRWRARDAADRRTARWRPSAGWTSARRDQRDPVAGPCVARRPRRPTRQQVRAVVAAVGAEPRAPTPVEESWSPALSTLTRRPARPSWPRLLDGAPVLPTGAGHDAGILAAAGVTDRDALRPQPDRRRPTPPPSTPTSRRLPGRRRGARHGARGAGTRVTTYHCDLAWLPPGRVARDVRIEVDGDRIVRVVEGGAPEPASGCAAWCCRGSRTRTRTRSTARCGRAPRLPRGTFWTWRDADVRRRRPSGPRPLPAPWPARRTPRWCSRASPASASSTTCTTARTARRTTTPTRWGTPWCRPPREAGLRLTLLDTCYLTGGVGGAADGVQRRFGDGDADRWAARAEALHATYSEDPRRRASALPCTRCAPYPPSRSATWRRGRPARGAVAHARVGAAAGERRVPRRRTASRRPACCTTHGVLGPRTTAVHATHLTDDDVRLLGGSADERSACAPRPSATSPTASARRRRLRRGRSPLTLGSDSHAVIDLFEEARAVELDERLASEAARSLVGGRAARRGDGRPGTRHSASPDAGVLARRPCGPRGRAARLGADGGQRRTPTRPRRWCSPRAPRT